MNSAQQPAEAPDLKGGQAFDDAGRVRASPHHDQVVEVVEVLDGVAQVTLMVRERSDYLTDR